MKPVWIMRSRKIRMPRITAAAILAAAATVGSAAPVARAQAVVSPTVSAAASPTPAAITATTPVLQAEIVGLRNDNGRVGCSLFNDAKAFPRDDSKMFRHVWAPIHGGRALCQFPGIPAGQYAMVVFHDENGDGEFNQNAFGMPEEGYGFSRDAAALFDAPGFDAASFHYDGTRLYMIINIRY
jgi:uncharacterized protein (DUF2141 family)